MYAEVEMQVHELGVTEENKYCSEFFLLSILSDKG